MMKTKLQLLAIWFGSLLILRLSLFLPHRYIDDIGLINTALQLLLFIISVQIVKKSTGSTRYIFLNLALFFGLVIPLFIESFVGESIFQKSVYANLFYYCYVNVLSSNFLLLFVILYIIIEHFHLHKNILSKYAICLIITSIILLPFFYKHIVDPFQLYSENEYTLITELKTAHTVWIDKYNREPSDEELTQAMSANTQSQASQQVVLNSVKELRRYLYDGGETYIFWKPLYIGSINVQSIVLFLIAAFLFLIYFTKKPVIAYIDKILIFFFLFCSFEILHLYGYINSHSFEQFRIIFNVGQYATIFCLLIMVYTFNLKLRFVLSVAGQYYEKAIHTSPASVTRWRDEIDNRMLKLFFRENKYLGRIGNLDKKSNNKGKRDI